MGVIFNFPSINQKATAANVRQFFKTDVEKLESIASSSLGGLYHSPLFDSIPTHNHQNGTELQVLKAIDARKELGLIIQSMKECTPISKTILVNKYIHHLQMFKISQLIGYGQSQTKQKQRQALIEFANHYAAHGRELRIMN